MTCLVILFTGIKLIEHNGEVFRGMFSIRLDTQVEGKTSATSFLPNWKCLKEKRQNADIFYVTLFIIVNVI
jgi:hypothetical protein